MRIPCTVSAILVLSAVGFSRPPLFTPSEEQISAHRAEVFKIARDYIVETFNLVPIEEARFNPVRFNSTGVWGDFNSRIKDLGDHRYEVQGWIIPVGHEEEEIGWSVVLRYELVNPDGWKYRRLDESYVNEAEITSWHFGSFQSIPYEADYSQDFLVENNQGSH